MRKPESAKEFAKKFMAAANCAPLYCLVAPACSTHKAPVHPPPKPGFAQRFCLLPWGSCTDWEPFTSVTSAAAGCAAAVSIDHDVGKCGGIGCWARLNLRNWRRRAKALILIRFGA